MFESNFNVKTYILNLFSFLNIEEMYTNCTKNMK